MIRLLLVRHGQTAWSVERRYQGHTDITLNEAGLREAEALGQHFCGQTIHTIYSSDLQRAAQTAAAIGRATGVPVTPEPRLREMAFGLWEGLTYREIQARFPQELAAFQTDRVVNVPPQGESVAQVAQRVADLLRDIAQRHDGQTVMLVSHGGALRTLICHALGLPSSFLWRIELDAASVSELHLYGDTTTITLLNDRHMLHGISA